MKLPITAAEAKLQCTFYFIEYNENQTMFTNYRTFIW